MWGAIASRWRASDSEARHASHDSFEAQNDTPMTCCSSSDQYAYARSMPSGCVSGRHALSKSVNVPGLIRRVVIQTNCSSIVASSRTDAVVATGTAVGRDPGSAIIP